MYVSLDRRDDAVTVESEDIRVIRNLEKVLESRTHNLNSRT